VYVTTPTEAKEFTILNGTNVSESYLDIGGASLMALYIPTGYTAGNITFTAAASPNDAFRDVYDATGTQVTVTVAGADRVVALTGTQLQAISSLRYIKIKTASNVNADRTIKVILKG